MKTMSLMTGFLAFAALLLQIPPDDKAEINRLLNQISAIVNRTVPPPIDPPPPPPPVVEMESPPQGAVLVTNIAEFKAALGAFKPVIAVQCGVYDVGAEEYRIDHYNPVPIRILCGYNTQWQRPKTLPSPLATYDPATGDTILPERLQKFLDTGLNETIILRSQWPPNKVGAAIWSQIRRELDRATFVGTRDPNTDQPQIFQGGARLTTRFKDCMTVQRYSRSHSYLTYNYLGGDPSIAEDCIFYLPFVGLAGNSRPQFLLGSDDSPASAMYNQHAELKRCCLLMPVNGGYHRLGFTGGTTVMTGCQFLSPNGESFLNLYSPRQLGFALFPGTKDVDWRTEWRDNTFVVKNFTIAPIFTRKFLTSGNKFYCQGGLVEDATLWADQALEFGHTNTVYLENGPFFPPADSLFQTTTAPRVSTRSGGRYEYQEVLKENRPQQIPVCLAGQGQLFDINPTIVQAPWKPVRYVHLKITGQQVVDRLRAGGEAECVKIFDEQYPALKGLP